MNKKTKIIISTVIAVLVLISVIFWQKNKNQPREAINTEAEVVKSEDNAAVVQIANHEMIQIRFSWEQDGIKYNDALNILKSEYDKLSLEQIEKMKQERFDNWVKMVNEQSKK
ncbi:MAG: hypothetical protein AAB837_01080 [Patescibacteria group bacterium]